MKLKIRKQEIYPLRERLHKAEVFTVLSAFLPDTPDNLKPVADKLAFDKLIRELGPIAAKMLKKDEKQFLHLLVYCGPKLLAEPSIVERLHWRWIQARWQEQPEGKAAKQFFQSLGQALSAGTQGRHRKLSDTERNERRRSDNRTTQNDRRALQYCNDAWDKYTKETKWVSDINTLRETARDIARRACAHGGTAKREGVRLFVGKVNQDLQGRTVTRK